VASYEAIINLVVQGEAALNRIQKKIDNLYKTVGDLETKKKFQGSQAAASFVRQQADELERVVSVSKQQIKEQERSIVKQSKLNAAVDLYERRQRQLSRTSVANQKQFAAQIKDIEDGFKFFKDRKNAAGVQAIATELGRIIEYDNELNRISDRRTANQRKLYSFSKEIAKYESFGLKTDRARKTLFNFEGVAGSNQLKQAQQYESALKNQLKLLKDQFIEQQRVARIAPSSPVLGGVNFPGSPKALTAQRKAEEIALRQSQRGFPSSPILGTPTMLGSPRAIAAQERTRVAAEKALRAQERAAKIAENAANKEAEKILRESQKGFPSSPIMGAATMAGSPKWIAAQERNRAASERRAATQQRAEQRAARIQQQAAIAAERAADKALKEAQKGFPSSPILGSATIAGSPRWKSAQESARQKLESAARATERAADRALKEAQKGFPSSPILGSVTMAGSPRAEQERLKREKEIAEATGLAGKAAQRLVGIENRTELASAIDEYLTGLSDVQSGAEKLLKKNAKSLKDFDQRLKERGDFQKSQEKAIADAWKMRGGPALPTGFNEAGIIKQKGASVDIGAQRRLQSVLASGAIIEQGLINLRSKGANVSRELVDLQSSLNTAKQKDYTISENTLDVLASQVSLAGKFAQLQRTILAGQAGGGRGGAEVTTSGLEQALQRLQEARGARQAFLGDTSPAQAIDQIVREFNKGASGGGAGQVAENVVDTYASGIKAGIPAVAQAMMNLGKAGIDAIKKALGMASPSRVMLAIAKNQIDTYVDFLRAALPAVEAVAKSLGEAGAPEVSGSKSFIVPESAIRRPITERARTRPLSAQDLERNSVIAEYAASQITGPMGQFENVKRKIEDFIDKTRTIVDLDKLFGGKENERFAMATRGVSAGPEFDKTRAALADFYQIPAELTPDLERGAKAANEAGVSADELARYVSGLAAGIEQIGTLLQSAAKLPTPSVATPATVVDNKFTRAQEAAARADAAAVEAARKKAEAQKPFEASIQKAAELDAEAKRKADAAVSSVVQAQIEADARAGAEAISKSILDPIESATPEGERQVRSAIGNLFDRVADALGFGGGGGGRPPVPPTSGGGGPTRDPEEFNRRLSAAADQGAEALLGLRELRDPTKATTAELEALSSVLKEFRKILDPTAEGFDRLEKQLRETAANLDRQVERRAPEAGFLTRRLGPRGARAASEGLIGGAFPLLFGQGLGATVGGGLGGALGGFAGGGLGFGLSLAGTAIGTAFDTATESAKNFTVALEDTGDATGALEAAFGRIDKETKTLIGNLAESGQRAAAAKASFEALAEKIGTEQAEAFQRAGEAASSWGAGVQTQLTKLYANAVLLAEAIAGIFPQQKTSVFDIVEAKPEQPLTQEARNRLEDLLGQNNLLEKQVALSRLNTDASVDQRLQLERQVALQDYVNSATELERQLKQNLLSQQEYNLRLKGSELNLTKQLYDLENAAAQERENRARQARQEAERAAKEQERAIASVLGLQSELMQVGLAGADIDIEGARLRGGEIAAIEEELNQLQQRFNYEARILDLQLQQKLVSSDISQQEKGLLESIYRQQLGNLKAQYDVRQATLQQASAQLQLDKFIATEEAKRQAVDPFTQFRQSQQLDQQYAQNYYRLLTEGIAPAEAQRLANFERLVSQQLNAVDSQIAITQAALAQAEAYGVSADKINQLKKNLEDLNASRGAITQEAARGAGPAPQEIPGAKIQEFISNAEEELKDLEALAVRVSQGIGDAIASSMANGITGLIEGTTTAKEVFAGFLKDVGNILIKEGTRMIGMYVAIGIAKMFAGLLSGAAGASKPALPGSMGQATKTGIDAGAGNISDMLSGLAADGAYFANGVAAFAKGGMFTNSVVSSPTLFKFADGGVQRTGLMGEAGPEAIMPLRRSASGRLGVEASGLREAMNSGAGGGMGTPSLNMTFETTNIGGVEYVSRDQLEAAMAATRRDAARDGAKRGMSMTLDKLQQSPGTRSRVGLR